MCCHHVEIVVDADEARIYFIGLEDAATFIVIEEVLADLFAVAQGVAHVRVLILSGLFCACSAVDDALGSALIVPFHEEPAA